MHNGPEAAGRCAPARLNGFGFDLPPHFVHCGSLFAKPARTNAHPTSLLNGQTQIRHSLQGRHILTLFGQEIMPLATPKGITVPFPDRLAEGYEVNARKSGGYHLLVNIDGTRLEHVFRDLVELVPDPGFLILETPCNEVKELELRTTDSDPFHRDIYYIDGLERYQFLEIFNEYSDLLVHDGFVHFGFGSHNTEQKDEVFVEGYKIVSIFGSPLNFMG